VDDRTEARIREGTPGDAAACAAVHVASWQVAYRGALPDEYLDGLDAADRLPRWQEWLAQERPRGCVLVAEVDGEVVGFGSFVAHTSLGDAWALIPNLYLAPVAIGRGVGAALMAAGLARLEADGFEHVELWVHPENDRARRFYERGGWTTDGTTNVEEVWGIQLDELRMTRALGGSAG
jgi:ribosomal protein S18 acetylase RimI-like enzyme